MLHMDIAAAGRAWLPSEPPDPPLRKEASMVWKRQILGVANATATSGDLVDALRLDG